MKNNALAMLATISIAVGLASIIGYVEPSACVVSGAEGIATCEEAASQQLWSFIGFTSFGVVTLLVSAVRSRRRK
jgi:uncharacterized protein (UPF0261 family)